MWIIDGYNATQIAKAMNLGGEIDPEICITQKPDAKTGKMILHVESKLSKDVLHQRLNKYMFNFCKTAHPLKLEPLEEEKWIEIIYFWGS